MTNEKCRLVGEVAGKLIGAAMRGGSSDEFYEIQASYGPRLTCDLFERAGTAAIKEMRVGIRVLKFYAVLDERANW
jgi:hypothetical protein